ncbi:energy transducer TonB [Denitratisoma sp. DHT3]|uniref:energy transducer TonB n=1 Tax=Denitratisoma sp. DHT3 TaxID=1981880 RepID=UPI001C95065B|nr:energy transducer TonB [Denitratisoma sp. DHT3]
MSIAVVVALHAGVGYALVTGLHRTVVDVIRDPFDVNIIEDAKKPPPDKPPPPPPKNLPPPPPPPQVPMPEVALPPATVSTGPTITVATKPEAPPPPPVASVRVPPVVSASSCTKPEYPAASKRLEEEGTVVLNFLIDVDGRVIQGKVEGTSGFERLDKAALDALGRCQFKPGTVDGKAEQAWAKMKYTFRLQN